MVSVVPGLHQALVWAVQRVQQRGAEERGAEGSVSSTCPTIKDSEEGERRKDLAEMFRGHPESNVSRRQNLDQVFLIDPETVLIAESVCMWVISTAL